MKGGNVTPSSTSSRNQSPRTVAAEARLRQAAGPRKASQRNSANLGSSNLQEELFRLINPDFISDSDSLNSERPRAYSMGMGAQQVSQGNRSNNSSLERAKAGGGAADRPIPPQLHATNSSKSHHAPQNQGPTPAMSVGYRNLPPGLQQPNPGLLSTVPQNPPESGHSTPQTEVAEVVVLTARPATVISNSSTSSPALTSEHKTARGQGHSQDQPQRPSSQEGYNTL